MRLRLGFALILIVLVVFLGMPVPMYASAHAGTHTAGGTHWQQYDTATYVVSTLNLLFTPAGQPLPEVWAHGLGVHRYDVYADIEHSALYYIELKRDDGATVGAFAYKLGWLKPRALVGNLMGLAPHAVQLKLLDAFRADPKMLLASFSSTLPTATY